MLVNNTMETRSTEVTSIRRRNNVEKFTLRTHRYFVDFESRIHVEISTSNWCHSFHVDSSVKIAVISTNFPRGISTSNRRWIDENVSIGQVIWTQFVPKLCNLISNDPLHRFVWNVAGWWGLLDTHKRW